MKRKAMMEWLKKYDVLTKALSVLIALVLWLYVVNVVNPSTEHTYHGITPVFVGEETIKNSQNLMVIGKYSVDVKISASRKDIRSLDKSDIRVEVDLSSITEPGTYELPITIAPLSSAYTIRRKNPEKLTVTVDREIDKVLPVEIDTSSLAADGYIVHEEGITKFPSDIRLVGRKEEIDAIAEIRVQIPKKKQKTSISGKMEFEYYDNNGKQIKETSVVADCEIVEVNIPIYRQKELPLSVEITGGELFADNIKQNLDPGKILVAGEEGVIEKMTSISVGRVDISEILSGKKVEYDLTMPDGIINMSGRDKVSATLSVNGLVWKTVTTSKYEIINAGAMPEGSEVKVLTKRLKVVVLGTEDAIAKVNAENVYMMVDLKSNVFSKGKHSQAVDISFKGVDGVAAIGKEDYVVNFEVR